MDEWLIYRRAEDVVPLPRMVAMDANGYDRWAETTGQLERHRFPVIARGLTETQARAMIELTKEKEDEI